MPKIVHSSRYTVHGTQKSVNRQPTTDNPTLPEGRRKSKGFTLIELLIVIVIIGVLATIGIYVSMGRVAQARDSIRKADLDQVKKALELAKSECKNSEYYPQRVLTGTAEQKYEVVSNGLATYLEDPDLNYLKKSPQDPKYQLTNPSPYYYGYAPDLNNYLSSTCPDVNGNPNSTTGTKDYRLVTKLEKTDDPDIAKSQTKCPWSVNFQNFSLPIDYAGTPMYVVCPG